MNTWNLALQDSNSPIYDMMMFFHDFAMIILTFIMMIIFMIIIQLMNNKFTYRFLLQGHYMEMIWTITPMIILILLAMPSLKILYMTDEMSNNKLTLKTIGHQWYWSYEYSDFPTIEFDSFMVPTDQLMLNEFRLLEVDNHCVLPYLIQIRILTTSDDVIHAWTIPSLGIKMDSTPGRLNQTMMLMNRPGLFYGQCSEICGTNHSFMPIVIEATNFINFKKWIIKFHNNI